MRFGSPQILWLMLVALPALAWFLIATWRQRQRLMTRFIQARLLPRLTARHAPAREQLRRWLLWAAAACLFLALARPQWGYTWEEAHQRGLDIVVAIDTSRSMLANDLQPNRLARAQLAALDLQRLARTDRLGLVAFAGTAFLQCPLTLDDQAFRQSVDALDVRIIPQGGTALAGAIETALGAFKDEDNHRALVLLSDGEDHDSQALAAAQKAARAGLRIFTLGVGTPEGEVLRLAGDQGALEYIKDNSGQPVKSRLNQALLQQIADAANGFYLPLDAPRAVEILYQQGLAPLPKNELTSRLTRRYHEHFAWPLALAILLLALEPLLPRTREKPISTPAPAPRTPHPRTAATIAVLLTFAGTASTVTASSRSALQAYDQGRLQQALTEYQRLREKDSNDPRLSYNLGTTAYQLKDYGTAARALTNALAAPDLSLQQRSFYNLGNTLYQLGEADTDTPNRQKLWQDAVRSFEAALKLEATDADASNNLAYVKARLEELQQQQQDQQNQQDQNDQQQDDQDQKNQQDQANQDSQQKDQSNDQGQQDQPQQDQPSSEQDQPQQPQPQNAPEDQKPQEGQQPDSPDQQPQPTEPSKGQPGADQQDPAGPPESERPEDTPSVPEGQMTPEQARQLFDGQKDSERIMIFLPPPTNPPPGTLLKDW